MNEQATQCAKDFITTLRALNRDNARLSAQFLRLAYRSTDEAWKRKAERLHLKGAELAGVVCG